MVLKQYREKAGMSKSELARETGLSRMSIDRYEKGIRTPSVPVAQRIASALGVEWTKFFEPINQQEEQSLETERQAM